MKKIALIALALLAFSGIAQAQMDDVTYSLSSVTTNTDSATYVVRGVVEAVYAVIPATKTATVAVATASGVTLFSKSMTSATDGYFPVLFPAYSSSGTALTTVISDSTNTIYTKIGVADAVTATVTPAEGTTGTNSYFVKLIVNE